jgi:non-homologous end joining protein Ku
LTRNIRAEATNSRRASVAIEDEELDALRPDSTHTIEIDDFVPAE